MSDKDFIIKKLLLMKQDAQKGFEQLVEPLQNLADKSDLSGTFEVPADGNWFKVSFKAVEIKKDRLVISATRKADGIRTSKLDPSTKEYVVEFHGTRAAYLYGYYEPRHPIYRWPYIHWDVRAYASHPTNPKVRVYVNGFWAKDEIRKLITAMEGVYGTSNIANKYIKDNLFRFQIGILAKKSPSQIEKAWSQGLMESLGYLHVEAFDTGFPKGGWRGVEVHWCKKEQDLRDGHV